MKIIFLDIDGVLHVISQGHDEYGGIFHPHLVDNLKYIIDQTDAKIVITSSWRKSSLIIMKEMWAHRNLPGEVIDTTASIYVFKNTNNFQFYNGERELKPTPKFRGYCIPRGCEIEYWLKCNTKHQIQSYVILDDDTDMLLSQQNKFVQCSGNIEDEDCIDIGYGLTKKCAEKAIQILNKI
jgi:hypothetical protein